MGRFTQPFGLAVVPLFAHGTELTTSNQEFFVTELLRVRGLYTPTTNTYAHTKHTHPTHALLLLPIYLPLSLRTCWVTPHKHRLTQSRSVTCDFHTDLSDVHLFSKASQLNVPTSSLKKHFKIYPGHLTIDMRLMEPNEKAPNRFTHSLTPVRPQTNDAPVIREIQEVCVHLFIYLV
jgi:hypothetical protein